MNAWLFGSSKKSTEETSPRKNALLDETLGDDILKKQLSGLGRQSSNTSTHRFSTKSVLINEEELDSKYLEEANSDVGSDGSEFISDRNLQPKKTQSGSDVNRDRTVSAPVGGGTNKEAKSSELLKERSISQPVGQTIKEMESQKKNADEQELHDQAFNMRESNEPKVNQEVISVGRNKRKFNEKEFSEKFSDSDAYWQKFQVGICRALFFAQELPLRAEDFRIKIETVLTPDLRFIEYAPSVFKKIRKEFGVTDLDVRRSLDKFSSVDKSEGKSKSLFIKSEDGANILKTINSEERDKLFQILPRYLKHIREEKNRGTLLPWFLGVFSLVLRTDRLTNTHLILMSSIFRTKEQIDEVYDLKGSTKGRTNKKASLTDTTEPAPGFIYKDLDWKRFNRRLHVSRTFKQKLLGQLVRDLEFLEENNIMDYSLLVGVVHHALHRPGELVNLKDKDQTAGRITKVLEKHTYLVDIGDAQIVTCSREHLSKKWYKQNEKVYVSIGGHSCLARITGSIPDPFFYCGFLYSAQAEKLLLHGATFPFTSDRISKAWEYIPTAFERCEEGIPAADESETYFLGIIDILQNYNLRKKTESFFRSSLAKKSEKPSCVSPEEYNKRFFEFVAQELFKVADKP